MKDLLYNYSALDLDDVFCYRYKRVSYTARYLWYRAMSESTGRIQMCLSTRLPDQSGWKVMSR